MKKWIAVCLACTLCLCFAGCGTQNAEDEKVVNFYSWEGYIPEDTITAFEQQTGIQVNYTNFSTNEEMYAKLKAVNAGEYDVVLASDFIFEVMAKEGGLMTELDKSKIPNFKNISEAYLDKSFDPGNKYTVPYTYGCTLLAYNKDTCPIPVTSYRDLLDPALKSQVVSIDEPRVVIGMMNLLNGNPLNETDPEKLQMAQESLTQLAPNIAALNSDTAHETMLAGDATVGLMYSSQVSVACQEDPAIQIVYPEEGIGIGIDSFFIPANAPHKDAAYQLINFLHDPEVNANIMPQINYGTVNKEAVQYLPEEFKNNLAVNVPDEYTKDSEIVMDVGDAAKIYSDMWNAFKTNL